MLSSTWCQRKYEWKLNDRKTKKYYALQFTESTKSLVHFRRSQELNPLHHLLQRLSVLTFGNRKSSLPIKRFLFPLPTSTLVPTPEAHRPATFFCCLFVLGVPVLVPIWSAFAKVSSGTKKKGRCYEESYDFWNDDEKLVTPHNFWAAYLNGQLRVQIGVINLQSLV